MVSTVVTVINYHWDGDHVGAITRLILTRDKTTVNSIKMVAGVSKQGVRGELSVSVLLSLNFFAILVYNVCALFIPCLFIVAYVSI